MRVADFCRECSCRSGRTPCGARDWLRLETAIPSAPSHTPRLGVVEPVCCDLHLDLYIRSLDAHGVSRNASWGGRTKRFAGLDVVDGPMPRACDFLARHLALREGAATVGAGVVNGVKGPLQVEEGDLLPRHLDALRLAGARSAVLATLMNCAMNLLRLVGSEPSVARQLKSVLQG